MVRVKRRFPNGYLGKHLQRHFVRHLLRGYMALLECYSLWHKLFRIQASFRIDDGMATLK